MRLQRNSKRVPGCFGCLRPRRTLWLLPIRFRRQAMPPHIPLAVSSKPITGTIVCSRPSVRTTRRLYLLAHWVSLPIQSILSSVISLPRCTPTGSGSLLSRTLILWCWTTLRRMTSLSCKSSTISSATTNSVL